jgi:hypothetical protein
MGYFEHTHSPTTRKNKNVVNMGIKAIKGTHLSVQAGKNTRALLGVIQPECYGVMC